MEAKSVKLLSFHTVLDGNKKKPKKIIKLTSIINLKAKSVKTFKFFMSVIDLLCK